MIASVSSVLYSLVCDADDLMSVNVLLARDRNDNEESERKSLSKRLHAYWV